MATDDFFRARLDSMIDMRHPLAVLATRMPWDTIEASLAPVLAHKDRDGRWVQDADLFGPTAQLAGAGPSNAGRPRLPIRVPSLITGEGYGNLTVRDHLSHIDPSVLGGQFFWGSAGVAVGRRSWDRGRVVVGRASGWNPEHTGGLDIGVSAIIGSSTVTSGRWEDCVCEPK